MTYVQIVSQPLLLVKENFINFPKNQFRQKILSLNNLNIFYFTLYLVTIFQLYIRIIYLLNIYILSLVLISQIEIFQLNFCYEFILFIE